MEKKHAEHLIAALCDEYPITIDWEGGIYCGVTLEWDYKNRTVDLSMPSYIANALHKFQHNVPSKP